MTSTAFAARHSMDSPEWYTPASFVEAARLVMGGIDLDPASHAEANEIVRADTYFTEQDNGLIQSWKGRVFLNPPGGLVAEFWRKLISEPGVDQFVWIGYSLEQLQTLQNSEADCTPLDCCLCVPRRRIAFVENAAKKAARIEKLTALGKTPNQKSQPSHGNYIAYLGTRESEFMRVFSSFGQTVIR